MQDLNIFISLIILIMSVVLHELSHGYAAAFLGDPTAKYAGRLTLNPLKHLDFMGSFVVPILTYLTFGSSFGWAKPVPYNPYNLRGGKWGPAVVAAAGPLSNLFLVMFFASFLNTAGFGFLGSAMSPTFIYLASTVVSINLLLFVVNIIPVPPIDGSKILFAILPYRYAFIQRYMERYALITILFLIVFFDLIVPPLYHFFAKLLL